MNSDYLGKRMKVLSVILGALLGGFIWRCRGESGFGSSWGLYSVGLVLILLIYHFYGSRRGMKYEMIPFGAFMTGLGVTGYATVIEQTAGFLYSDLPYQGEVINAPINPYSGMVIVLIMGFTLVPLFSFFVGSLFSKKEFKFYHYLITIGLFFAVQTLCKATISHSILSLINPEQVKYAALGLADRGFDYESPMKAYMDHFLNRSWTQEIPFFENYYMSIEHISDLFATIAVSLYPLIVMRDKVTCFVSFIINCFTSVATTVASSLMIVQYNTGLLGQITTPRSLGNGAGWGLWEYATGASVGLITMLVLAFLPKALTAKDEIDNEPLFKNKKINFLFNIIVTVFVLSVTPWRAIGLRIGKLLMYEGVLEDSSPTGEIIMAVGAVLLGLYFVIFIGKNMFKKDTTPLGVTPVRFARVALPAYIGMCCFLYFFLNHGYIFHLPYSEMTSFSAFIYTMTDPKYVENLLMAVTFIAFLAIYIPVRKKLNSGKSIKAKE